MSRYPRLRIISLPALIALTFSLLVGLAPPVQAGQSDNLPIYTSPIDITGLPLRFQAVAPKIDGPGVMNVPIPGGLLGPKMTKLLGTPLSSQFDQFWANQRATACDGIKAQVQAAVKKIGSSYDSYDVNCDLALTGRVLVQQVDSWLYVAYLLTNNVVTFAVTSPFTCRSDNGTFLCPNDPRFKVTFATEIVTLVHAADACHITSEGGTVYTQSVNIDEKNVSGAIAVAVDDLFLGHEFTAAEQAIGAVTKEITLPLDAGFKELREADACTGKNPFISRALVAFRDFDVSIDRTGVVFRLGHAGIPAPILYGPSFGVSTQPTFTRPMIATPQPIVAAGKPVGVTGQYFPMTVNLATALPIGLHHGGYGANSVLLNSGVCLRGMTVVQSAKVNEPMAITFLPGSAQGYCANSYYAAALTPQTTYQFRARDCDEITCSPWSALLQVTTTRLDPGAAGVLLTLDGGTPLGSTTVDALGKFDTMVTIPAGTPAGTHMIHAVNRNAKADVAIQVTAASGGGKASMIVVGVLKGEPGCPNHPLTSTQTDSSFMLFGTGFNPGPLTVRLDSATGFLVGAATAKADGNFCQEMAGVPSSLAGSHALTAVQNGAVQAQTTVSFVLPPIIH